MMILDDACIFAEADQRGAIEALRRAFLDPGHTPARMHENLPGGDRTLLIMPCWLRRDWIGVKVATVMPANPEMGRPTVDGTYLLLDGQTGQTVAILSAPALTAIRTAGISALAASLLARGDAKTLLMIGTGALAPHLVRAHCMVRPIERVILWGRDARKATNLKSALPDLRASIEIASGLDEAIGKADIISSATLSREPLIRGDRVAPGTHVDLVGSFTPDMREADTALFQRGRLVVDTETAFAESGDVMTPVAAGAITTSAPDLTALLQWPALGRGDDTEVTIFKSVGTALADLAVASDIFEKARARRDRAHAALKTFS